LLLYLTPLLQVKRYPETREEGGICLLSNNMTQEGKKICYNIRATSRTMTKKVCYKVPRFTSYIMTTVFHGVEDARGRILGKTNA